jgi:hypothetical protein
MREPLESLGIVCISLDLAALKSARFIIHAFALQRGREKAEEIEKKRRAQFHRRCLIKITPASQARPSQ